MCGIIILKYKYSNLDDLQKLYHIILLNLEYIAHDLSILVTRGYIEYDKINLFCKIHSNTYGCNIIFLINIFSIIKAFKQCNRMESTLKRGAY